MTDRIANPWGERTPFGAGEDWPVRVDRFLEDGVSEDEVDRWVQTASLHHANGDALDLAVKEDRLVGVRGRAVDRVNRGRLGPRTSSSGRLMTPLTASGGS
jgi:ferredoxin-nitrate reductase